MKFPERTHRVTWSACNSIFALYFEPKWSSTIASLVCQCDFEDLDSLANRIEDLFAWKLKSFDALFFVNKFKVNGGILQLSRTDWVHNPVGTVDVSVKIIVLRNVDACRADLVGKALVDVLDLPAVLFYDCLGVRPLNAWRQIKDHWDYAQDWQLFNEYLWCVHNLQWICAKKF